MTETKDEFLTRLFPEFNPNIANLKEELDNLSDMFQMSFKELAYRFRSAAYSFKKMNYFVRISSNNWRKMHKLPMRRKIILRKVKNKNINAEVYFDGR